MGQAVKKQSTLLPVRWFSPKVQAWQAAQWSVIIGSFFRKLLNMSWDPLIPAKPPDPQQQPCCWFLTTIPHILPQVFFPSHHKGNDIKKLLISIAFYLIIISAKHSLRRLCVCACMCLFMHLSVCAWVISHISGPISLILLVLNCDCMLNLLEILSCLRWFSSLKNILLWLFYTIINCWLLTPLNWPVGAASHQELL